MAKNKKQRKQKEAQQAKRKLAVRPGPMVEGRSKEFRDYAKLLLDPCSGPLVHPPGSNSSGIITRFEKDLLFGTEATTTCGALILAPGCLNNAAGGNSQGYVGFSAALDGASATVTTNGQEGIIPGWNFIRANCSSYRCLAMCVQVYWPGSELSRAGIVSGAQVTYGSVRAGSNSTVERLRSACPVVERMPTTNVEYKWAPTFADGMWRSPLSATVPEDGHGALLVTFSGIPVSTGVRVRIVTVIEWQPFLDGLTVSNTTSTEGAGSQAHVRNVLDRTNTRWWYDTGLSGGQLLSGLLRGMFVNNRGPNFEGQPIRRIEL